MEGRCATCRHWIAPADGEGPWGGCAMVRVHNTIPERPDSLALAWGGDSTDEAGLETAPDFGCVQYERRED